MARAAGNERGVTLFMVLWVLVLLSMIVGEFCYTTKTALQITGNFKEKTEARYIALGGTNAAVAGMVDRAVYPTRYLTVSAEDDNGEENKSIPWRINAENPEGLLGRGSYEVWIDNESGKININKADNQLLELLFQQFDLTDDEVDVIVASILDWRDDDHLKRLNGAEDDYYTSLADPYNCRDGYFESVEELAYVRGVTSEMITPEFKALVTVFVPPLPYSEEELNKKTREAYLLREKMKNYKTYDYNYVNINAAHRELLLLVPGMTPEDADAVLAYRREKDVAVMSELMDVIDSDVCTSLQRYFRTTGLSSYYTVRATGYASGKKVRTRVTAFVEINTKLDKKYRLLTFQCM